MGKPLTLLDFETADIPPEHHGPTPDYLDGYEAGKAEAHAGFLEQQTHLSAELIAAIADMRFGYTEARTQLLAEIVPLLRAICSQLLPALHDDALRSYLTALLIEKVGEVSSPEVKLCLHPDNIAAIEAAISRFDGQKVTLVPDAAIGTSEARWHTKQQEYALDLSPLIASIRNALNSIIDDTERQASHG